MPEISVGGRRIHYEDVGNGEPVLLLLHAFPLSSEMWAHQLACLSATRRVVAPDMAGFGHTDALTDPSAAAMGDLAGDVVAVLEHLRLASVVVGGLSMGGYVAFDLFRRRPELVAGLVLADTRAAADTPEVVARRTAQQEQVARGDKAGVVDALLGGLLGASTQAARPELVDHVRTVMSAQADAAYVGALGAMKRRPDSTALLTSIEAPALVLVGEEDALSPPASVREWQSQIPRSRLVELAHAGHLSNLEAPGAFNTAVDDFLAEL